MRMQRGDNFFASSLIHRIAGIESIFIADRPPFPISVKALGSRGTTLVRSISDASHELRKFGDFMYARSWCRPAPRSLTRN